jgi:hypothetical protein
MATDLEDATFSFMLRSIIPLLVAPPGPLPSRGPRLRGVVRVDHGSARVVLSDDPTMTSGLAVQFALSSSDRALNVEAAIDYLRANVATDMVRFHSLLTGGWDSHHNLIVKASEFGFSNSGQGAFYDHSLFGLASLLVHGGGFPWFEDLYTFAGLMLRGGNKCRIYIRRAKDRKNYGIEIPLSGADGRTAHGFGGSLPQELAPLVRGGDLFLQPTVDDHDDYCGEIFDMARWVSPAPR